MKHTQGRWTPGRPRQFATSVFNQDGGKIATVYRGCECNTVEQGKANLKLIAAAPELLKSLEQMLRAWELLTRNETERLGWDAAAEAKRLIKTLS